jgi:hypothetical protein
MSGKNSERITVAVNEELLKRLRVFCAHVKRTHQVDVPLSNAARSLIERGLIEWETSQGKKGRVR